MPGYLDAYGAQGAADARRSGMIKRIILGTLAVVLVGLIVFFTFRTWREEQIMKHFLSLLRAKDYQRAYTVWGCTPDHPCKYYPPDKFLEDFGPNGVDAKIVDQKLEHVDFCDSGVVFNFGVLNNEDLALRVERSDGSITFAPWPRCPGKHLQLWEFLKSRFKSS